MALSKYPDIDVEVYESADKFGEVGAGIGLFSRMSSIILLFSFLQLSGALLQGLGGLLRNWASSKTYSGQLT